MRAFRYLFGRRVGFSANALLTNAVRSDTHRSRRGEALADKISARPPGAEARLFERAHDVSIVVAWHGRRFIGAAATIPEACELVLVSASRPRTRTPRFR